MNTVTNEQAILNRIGQIPVFDTLGVEILELAEGLCKARVPKKDSFDGIYESYHGGMLMTAADTIACPAIMTLTGADAFMATTDMNIRFLSACLTDVIVEARVIKFGKTLCPVQVDLFDTSGKHVAVAQVTYMVGLKAPAPGR